MPLQDYDIKWYDCCIHWRLPKPFKVDIVGFRLQYMYVYMYVSMYSFIFWLITNTEYIDFHFKPLHIERI